MTPEANLSLVSPTPVANLPLASTTPAANFGYETRFYIHSCLCFTSHLSSKAGVRLLYDVPEHLLVFSKLASPKILFIIL
jgi:hypothetical protein